MPLGLVYFLFAEEHTQTAQLVAVSLAIRKSRGHLQSYYSCVSNTLLVRNKLLARAKQELMRIRFPDAN